MSAASAAPVFVEDIMLLCPDGVTIALPPNGAAGSTFLTSYVADTGDNGTTRVFEIDVAKLMPEIPTEAVKMAVALLCACEDVLDVETKTLAEGVTQKRLSNTDGAPIMPAMCVFFHVQRFADVFDCKALYAAMKRYIASAMAAATDPHAIYAMCEMTPDPTWNPERPELRDALPSLPKSVVRARLIAERTKALAAVQEETQPMDVEAAARADADLAAFELSEIEKARIERKEGPALRLSRSDAPPPTTREEARARYKVGRDGAQGGAAA